MGVHRERCAEWKLGTAEAPSRERRVEGERGARRHSKGNSGKQKNIPPL